MIPCHSIWELWSNLVWVNLIHLASSSWLTIPSAFSSILFQRCISGFLNFLIINPHQGDIITCPQWPPISSGSPQDWVRQTPPPGPLQGTPRGHSRGRGHRDADGIKLKLYECVPYLLLFQKEVFHEGPCHAPFRAPALVHIEPKIIIHLFCYRTNHCKQ